MPSRTALLASTVAAAAAAVVAAGNASCSTALDCSLNGLCTAGVCVCAAPWHGPGCELIKFKPVTFPQGYGMAPNLTTWGGGAIYDAGTKKYHSYISSMTNDCGLETWGENSRIEHGVADTVTGPYEFVDVAVPTWSHNAAPIALPDGTFAIVHIGGGTGAADGGRNCTCEVIPGGCPPPPPPPPCPAGYDIQGWRCYTAACAAKSGCTGSNHCDCGDDIGEPKLAPCQNRSSCAAEVARACEATHGCDKFTVIFGKSGTAGGAKLFGNASKLVPNKDWTGYVKIGSAADLQLEAAPATSAASSGGSTIHISKSLNGPWKPLSPNTLGGCNNPAPWVHPNATIFIVCGNSLKRSESIEGPWREVTTFSHAGGPKGAYEDPFLFTDIAGHFHLIYHVYTTDDHGETCTNSTVSAHVFSETGFDWHAHPVSPYGTHVELASGDHVVVATRERPKLFFNESGHATHLFNGVCGAPNCPGEAACVNCKTHAWDYTLVVPLDV